VPPAQTFAVVGASLAGGTAAASLREEGFDGRLVLIGDEPSPPYERPGLSKRYLRGEASADELAVRPEWWWQEHGVETQLGVRVESLDPIERVITLADGERLAFDRALIATGVRNRRFDVPGAHLPGVFQLRTIADAEAIRTAAAGASRAVIVGMGFIGAEVAASLRQMGLEVTVVEIFETALYRVLGPQIGRVLEAIHRHAGVTFHLRDVVERFEGGERVERVVTRAGAVIDTELVVVGIGTQPNAEVLGGTGVAADGGIAVGPWLETEFPGVFAAGDVASHRHPVFGDVRVEHFDNAIKMGVHAARAMLGSTEPFDDPHWFWSDQWDHEIQMAGVAVGGEMVVRGSFEDRSFCAFFLDGRGELCSAVSLDWKRDVRRSLELIRRRVRPDPDALADPDVDLRTLSPSAFRLG
jgi:3-phenylpropionate/trans-cinnamate dioxygenase ferredoxin reductase subunit